MFPKLAYVLQNIISGYDERYIFRLADSFLKFLDFFMITEIKKAQYVVIFWN